MKDIFSVLSGFLLKFLTPTPSQDATLGRLSLKLAAFLCLIIGYILSCRAVYYRLQPYWGEALSLLIIGGVFVVTGGLLFIIIWLLTPKNSSGKDLITTLIKSLEEILPTDILKNRLSVVLPKVLMTFFLVGAVTYYFRNFQKKE